MGVDHGGRGGQVTMSPPKFGVGDANANCPLRLLSYTYKKEHSVAFKICQNPFSGLCPGPRRGSSRRSQGPLVGWRGDTPPHTPPHSAPTHLRRSPCVSPEFQPDLRLRGRGICRNGLAFRYEVRLEAFYANVYAFRFIFDFPLCHIHV